MQPFGGTWGDFLESLELEPMAALLQADGAARWGPQAENSSRILVSSKGSQRLLVRGPAVLGAHYGLGRSCGMGSRCVREVLPTQIVNTVTRGSPAPRLGSPG